MTVCTKQHTAHYGFGLLAVCLLLTAGCEDSAATRLLNEKSQSRRSEIAGFTVDTSFSAPPPPPVMDSNSLADAVYGGGGVGETYEGLEVPVPGKNNDADYIMKSDIYWKMNWIKKQIDSMIVPPQLDQKVAKLREQIGKSLEDDKKPLMLEICDLLERGLDAHRMISEMKRYGVDARQKAKLEADLTFSPGAVSDPFSMDPAEIGTSSRRRKTERSAEKWSSTHGESPEIAKRNAFNEASLKIDQLAQMLGLNARPENLKPGETPRTGFKGTRLEDPVNDR